jgi:hypothetical protein
MFSSSIQNGGFPCLQDMQIAKELARTGAFMTDFFRAGRGTIDSGKNLTPSRGTTRHR